MRIKSCATAVAGPSLLIVGVLALLSVASQHRQPPSNEGIDDALHLVERFQTVDSNVELVVTNNQSAKWILGDGFLTPDATGAWLSETQGWIRFRTGEGTPVSVELTLTPLLAPSVPELSITVATTVDELERTLRGGEERILLALDGETQQDVKLACSEAASPQALGLSVDQRPFCIKLLSVRVNVE